MEEVIHSLISILFSRTTISCVSCEDGGPWHGYDTSSTTTISSEYNSNISCHWHYFIFDPNFLTAFPQTSFLDVDDFAIIIGYFMTRLILSLTFYALFTSIGLI